jgi:hypothetical protein
MLDHGHSEAATAYALDASLSRFPTGAVSQLIAANSDRDVHLALLRRAAEAWRATDEPRRPFRRNMFVNVFQCHWRLFPEGEARALAHEIVDDALSQPARPGGGTYDPEGTVRINSAAEGTLFQIFAALRSLDSAGAESLRGKYTELAAALERFPNGMESVLAEAVRDAEEFGNFEAPFRYALERYAEDASEVKPNMATKALWRSTNGFSTILYRAGKIHGVEAASLLDRIPDEDVRLLAAIELEAALHGLPEVRGMISIQHRGPKPMLGSAVAEPGTETPNDVCGPHIRCPKCKWQPRKHDRWACTCRHMWNTFDTGGVCPACMKQWTVTQCLACLEMSPHSDWYAG